MANNGKARTSNNKQEQIRKHFLTSFVFKKKKNDLMKSLVFLIEFYRSFQQFVFVFVYFTEKIFVLRGWIRNNNNIMDASGCADRLKRNGRKRCLDLEASQSLEAFERPLKRSRRLCVEKQSEADKEEQGNNTKKQEEEQRAELSEKKIDRQRNWNSKGKAVKGKKRRKAEKKAKTEKKTSKKGKGNEEKRTKTRMEQKDDKREKNVIVTLKQDIECGICTQTYVAPVTLHCGHSFCYMCLKEHMKHSSCLSSPKCPICRRPCETPMTWENKFAINYSLQSLIDKMVVHLLDADDLADHKQRYQQYVVCICTYIII
ncbi:ring finger protein 8 [Reticulomyxa filosa]|uniref:Ring finger protein 8 n=1 Tax=Reticulomyxa filosa TaxID=46433 RepID=X6M3B3_RETFI|nr:ring finger protein 8 [Reticulomyxa filosa]|eukprot:ETO08458.1 ring finger protein 8 [Reticulomyxa filosa]